MTIKIYREAELKITNELLYTPGMFSYDIAFMQTKDGYYVLKDRQGLIKPGTTLTEEEMLRFIGDNIPNLV